MKYQGKLREIKRIIHLYFIEIEIDWEKGLSSYPLVVRILQIK
jgi:hypothetical protein